LTTTNPASTPALRQLVLFFRLAPASSALAYAAIISVQVKRFAFVFLLSSDCQLPVIPVSHSCVELDALIFLPLQKPGKSAALLCFL
jgi:hypothetical protein